MNTKELEAKRVLGEIVAYSRPAISGGGIARVKVIETGLKNPKRPNASVHDYALVGIVSQAGITDNSEGHRLITVPTRHLSPWDDDSEHTMSLLMDRLSIRDDVRRVAAETGVVIHGFDAVSQTVTLKVDEFYRVAAIVSDSHNEGDNEPTDPPMYIPSFLAKKLSRKNK